MPIYCFKCEHCGVVLEKLHPMKGVPRYVGHVCKVAGRSVAAPRHFPSELPAAHTDGGFHFTPHVDVGAGRHFGTSEEYRAWQQRNVDEDGSVPEPVEGKRKKAMIEEALHANHINKQAHFDDKAFTAELQRCYDDAHEDLSKRAAMGLAPPPLDQSVPPGYRDGVTEWTE